MKKIFACLLALLLLASCSTVPQEDNTALSEDVSAETAPDAAGSDETMPAETENPVDELFKVAAEDNGAKTFSLLTTETHRFEYDASEQTGEVVNDAVFKRNMAVEELLGIDLNFIYKPGDWENKDSYCRLITNSVMAADGAYDVVTGMISCVQPIATSQLFMNVYDLQDIDMNNPWWVSEMQEDLTINGKLIGFIGDMSLSMYKGLSVIFANMNLIDNMGMDNPYTMVLEGEWTLDKMIEQTTGIGQDVDGDGTYTLGTDVYGMAMHGIVFDSIQASLDIQTITLDEEGLPIVNPLSDKMTVAYDKLTPYLKENGILCKDLANAAEDQEMYSYFAADQFVYFMGKLEVLDYTRDMESDYAVLPFPKYDENQDKHLTLIATATHMIYVPTTTNDISLTGKVCESMSYYSYKDVIPAYYDVTLKNKYSRDENTQKMMDIIRAGAVLPFEYAYSQVIGGSVGAQNILAQTSRKDDGKLASTLAQSQRAWQVGIKAMLKSYSD